MLGFFFKNSKNTKIFQGYFIQFSLWGIIIITTSKDKTATAAAINGGNIMTDYNNDKFDGMNEVPSEETPITNETPSEENLNSTDVSSNDIYSSSSHEEPEAQDEGSYEWNAEPKEETTEYHYSYINGNNTDAEHNPNNYNDNYSSYGTSNTSQSYQSDSYSDNANTQTANQQANPYSYNYSNTYNNYSSAPNYNRQHTQSYNQPPAKKEKKKKEKKPVSRGFIAAMLVITVLCSAALGFGGGMLAKNMNTTTNGNVTINQVNSSGVKNAGTTTAASTSEIVKKTADSVVEIATEGVVTGNFAQQYVTKGAGSGVIISADGYIVTNHHVIDNAKTIKVTLRDGQTTYDATLIGSDEDNDIALLKVNAEGLTPATFGDSASLAVGDYVVAIGNPLGTLGGTVTDGIVSALAREVTIENKNMTLLQTNAQISPGNSGGGLFNANGELVGIVNAKDSATEVEGIAFAIPVNNVIDIIKDLQNYGYVTGKIDLGMEFVDINSNDTAFYYGVNQLGCYVLSVTSGSNAEQAGFKRGDLITAVNGTEISQSSEISKALENNKVGDKVTLTVSRSGRTTDIELVLEEYVPSAKLNSNNSQSQQQQQQQMPQGGSDLWDQIFGW